MKLGFICEGKTEKKIVESEGFQQFLASISHTCIPDIIDADGMGNLLPVNLPRFTQRLIAKGAERIIILTDLDEDACITITKQRIQAPENHIVFVSVKTVEAWFLADTACMSAILKQKFHFDNPESMDAFETISEMLFEKTGRGANSKKKLASMMINNGFKVESAAAHPNCNSAKYLVDKLKLLSA